MTFMDLKNDFVFRRIFGSRSDVLRGLLNDLLERTGERTIEDIEYLPAEQMPTVATGKLSVLDVRCCDRTGATFLVEMQLLHIPGFHNRVVYDACKSYAAQINIREPDMKLADVVVISICDFELWPDAEADAHGQPRVPMLSRWNIAEQQSGRAGLLQVQYLFLELPKLDPGSPHSGTEWWAWLFVHGPDLVELPAELPQGPQRVAVELANEATFTRREWDAARRATDEVQGVLELLAESKEKGRAEGLAKARARGLAKGKANAILALLALRSVAVSDPERARITACGDEPTLDRWFARALTAAKAEDLVDSPAG